MKINAVLRKVDGKAIMEVTNEKNTLVVSIHPDYVTGATTVSWYSKGLQRLTLEQFKEIAGYVESVEILNG